MFRKILIANRGEVAVRILRACRELGVRSVAVYSDADRAGLHVRLADEAYRLGPSPSPESYLAAERVLAVARKAQCDALHPGYGFLSENPAFARACVSAGVTFIGPSPQAMEQLGLKTAARHLALDAGVQTVAGTLDPIENLEGALRTAHAIGFPVVLKAVAGGGGKGMRLVEREGDFASAWRNAASESKNAFGDERLYLEKYLLRPRHIEIQVLGDHHGHIVHLGERECSVQRRYQKVIEEAPSPSMTDDLRREMGEAAVKLARAGGYTNAGTVEFLVDREKQFYFLEMNTRLQVEHPVTEMVTSVDLVKLQIRIAAGEPLPFAQGDVALRGHSIECRVYAEDPDNNFFPSPGRILGLRAPCGPGIRFDGGVYEGWTVPNEYDPMLGKLIAWGCDRAEATARLRGALEECYATGIKTNLALFRRILAAPDFQNGDMDTRWLDEFLREPNGEDTVGGHADAPGVSFAEDSALVAAALSHMSRDRAPAGGGRATDAWPSRWRLEARREQPEGEPERSQTHED
jgi:acetyl-CoA carboxylase biotin carboxylase subunit